MAPSLRAVAADSPPSQSVPRSKQMSKPTLRSHGQHRHTAVTMVAVAVLSASGGSDNDRPAPLSAEAACNAFLGRSIEGAVITVANLVVATDTAPEHCLVRGEMPQDLDFEVRMPTEWNRRTVFLGGGG